MQRKIWILLLILVGISLNLCAEITISSELNTELTNMAKKNISVLPKEQIKCYTQLLNKYSEGVMAFLLASEENSKLLLANPLDIEKHYLALMSDKDLENRQYNERFLLSYICKITVSDERISFYRNEMEKQGLNDIRDKYPNLKDRVRAVNLWCKSKVLFEPTSGRDLAPLDMLQKCNVGRCEENQIFFIAAARTAGIPARPAFTPFWAHADNNHAWAEVFIDGKWCYLGACEPEYDLNHSWFTSLIDKAVLVNAEGTLPDNDEEILVRGRYQSYINSTSYYQSEFNRTRKIKFTVKHNSEIVKDANISILVYNWGSLRSIMEVLPDSTGSKSISLGQGSLFVLASKDSLVCLKYIPESSKDEEMELNLTNDTFTEMDYMLSYPKSIDKKWDIHPEFEAERDNAGKAYNEIIKAQKSIPFPDQNMQSDSLLMDVWSKCRFNKDAFYAFYKSEPTLDKEFLVLLSSMDVKLIYQANSEQFRLVYDYYKALKQTNNGFSEDINLRLINPTCYFEEIPSHSFPAKLAKWRKMDTLKALENICKYVNKTYTNDYKNAVAGIIPFDYAVKQKYLNINQMKMLMVSLLRYNFIPAEFTGMPNAISVYYHDKWQHYDVINLKFLSDNTNGEQKSNEDNVSLKFLDEYGQSMVLAENQLMISLLYQGELYDNDIQPVINNERAYQCYLNAGQYYLQIGYRINSENTKYYLFPLEIKDNIKFTKEIVLKSYPYEWNELSDEYLELSKLVNTDNCKDNIVLLLGDFDREMIHRLNDKILEKKSSETYFWYGSKTTNEKNAFYQVNTEYTKLLNDNKVLENQLLTLYYNKDKAKWYYYQGMWDNLPVKK